MYVLLIGGLDTSLEYLSLHYCIDVEGAVIRNRHKNAEDGEFKSHQGCSWICFIRALSEQFMSYMHSVHRCWQALKILLLIPDTFSQLGLLALINFRSDVHLTFFSPSKNVRLKGFLIKWIDSIYCSGNESVQQQVFAPLFIDSSTIQQKQPGLAVK